MKSNPSLLSLVPLFSLMGALFSSAEKPKAYTSPDEVDADFAFQGEYVGTIKDEVHGVQIIALGNGEFEAVGYLDGLPGDGWDGEAEGISRTKGTLVQDQGFVRFERRGRYGDSDGKKISVTRAEDSSAVMELVRVERSSPTLGAKAPDGAVILFAGEDQNDFKGASVTEDGLLTEGGTSEETFEDFQLHLEFRLPYMPEARSQARGNSGLYLQGRYEIQMLDSFGLEGKDNECGGIYQVAAPKENLCFPPLSWQTYDVDFTAAKFNEQGEKTANARLTLKHNGVVIHDEIELPGTTGGASLKEDGTAGPIHLQNHGDPVRYRNIWVLKK